MSDLEQELKDKIKQARAESGDYEVPKEPEKEVIEDDNNGDNVDDDVVNEEFEKEEEEVEEEDLKEELELDEEKAKDPKAKNAFQKMRNELKRRDEEYNQLKIELAKVQGMQEAMQKPKDPEPVVEEVPDKEYEPEAWYEYQLKQRDKKLEAIENQLNNFNQQTTVSNAERVYTDLESKYIESDPSYLDAKKYYKSERARALRSQYPMATDAQIQQEVKAEEYRIVASLSQAGLESDAIFNTIKSQAVSLGYKDLPPVKRDNTKLKRNMQKSASLNDASTANGDMGFSPTQMARMGVTGISKLLNNPKEMKKAMKALAIARMNANN